MKTVNEAMQIIWTKYLDKHGLVTQLDRNGGDTCQKTFSLTWIYSFSNIKFWHRDIRLLFIRAVQLEKTHGMWTRAVDFPDNDIWNFTRDQATPLVMELGRNKEWRGLWSWTWRHICRLGFFPNFHKNSYDRGRPSFPDMTGFGFLNVLIRAWLPYTFWLYPILFIGDFFLIIQSLIEIYKRRQQPLTGPLVVKDPNRNTNTMPNHLNLLGHAKRYLPTPFSWIAGKITKKWASPKEVMLYYYREENNGPPMGEIYAAYCDEVL